MPERDEMTLERACEILTKNKHDGFRWFAAGWKAHGEKRRRGDIGYMTSLSKFEAIAVAEKYERDSTPAPAAPPPGAAEGDAGEEYRLCNRADGVDGHYSIGRRRDGYWEFWGPQGWSSAGHVFLLAAAEARPQTLRSQVLALASLKDGWHDGDGTDYDPARLEAVAGLLERLAGIATGQVYPVPSGLSEPSGLVRVEWGDRPRDDSLEIDPVTLAARIHLYDLDSGETLIGEIMPESLAEARPVVGEATKAFLRGLAEYLDDHDGAVTMEAWVVVDELEAALRECGIEVPR